MIIGAIVDVSASQVNPGNSGHNGASLFHFYSMNDAVTWAELQSQNADVAGSATTCLCTVINTDDATRRWWFNGTEYTG